MALSVTGTSTVAPGAAVVFSTFRVTAAAEPLAWQAVTLCVTATLRLLPDCAVSSSVWLDDGLELV